MGANAESPINAALRHFEAAEANLEKLERVWKELQSMVPEGIAFGNDPIYDDRCRAFNDLLQALPSIDGWKPSSQPPDLNELAHARFDAQEICELSVSLGVEEWVDRPARELAEYRYRFNKKRRQLVRDAMLEVMTGVDATLRELHTQYENILDADEHVEGSRWEQLKEYIEQIAVLLGNNVPKPPRWNDLHRHLAFAMIKGSHGHS